MSDKKFEIRVLNFNKDNNIPTFKESSNKQWIMYGSDNLYPQFLLDIYHNRSNKHKAIINKKAKMIAGNGFIDLENPSQEYIDFIENSFGNGTLEDISKKIAYDLEIYNGYCIQIKWSRDRTKIASISYVPYEKVRLSTDDQKLWLSPDWKNYRKSENTPIEVQRFNRLLKEEFPTQYIYVTESQPGLEYYPIPNYSSTLTWIEADWEISNFHLNSIKNGFSAGFLLNFSTGIPTIEEMDMAQKEFTRKYTGSTNAGKFILTFSDGKETAPELTPIELNTSDERFIILSNQIKEEIFIGHEVTSPMLFGVRTEGQLGGRNELLESMELFQSTYIDYKQILIENILNKIAKINNIPEKIELARYELFKDGNVEQKNNIQE